MLDNQLNKVIPQRAPQNREAPVPSRGPTKRRSPEAPLPTRIQNIFKDRQSLVFDQNTGFQGGPSRRKGYRLALWSWLASFIDVLILISLSSVFLLTFSLIVKTSLGGLLGGIVHSQNQTVLFAEVFFISVWIYTVAVRGFMGATIGEWACDLRLGQPHERLQSGYVLKVALRSTVILLTGIITLPILSMLCGRDLPGIFSGLRLFSLK